MRSSISSYGGTLSIILVAFALLFSYPIAYYSSGDIIEIKVKEKERITSGSGENITSKFIVYTENEVFENTDSWLFLKFSSADFQNSMEVGKTYKVKVAGWRIPFLSWYRNIIAII